MNKLSKCPVIFIAMNDLSRDPALFSIRPKSRVFLTHPDPDLKALRCEGFSFGAEPLSMHSVLLPGQCSLISLFLEPRPAP